MINEGGIRATARGGIMVVTRDDRGRSLAHELGHALVGLRDEYTEDEGLACHLRAFLDIGLAANVSDDPAGAPHDADAPRDEPLDEGGRAPGTGMLKLSPTTSP